MATPPVLSVGILEARGLLAGDLNGLSDPFVRVQLLDERGDVIPGAPTTKTSIKTKTLSPVWHESVVLGDGDALDLRVVATLRFLVLDYDGYKRDDTLGVVDVPVDTALQLAEQGSDDWYRVMKVPSAMSKDATGELRLSFARQMPPVEPAVVALSDSDDAAPNLLFVTIDSGRDLLAMDRGNTSDPLVKLSLTGQRFHTTTIEKTLKPHWDERFAFLAKDLNTTLDLLVEDEDRTVNDFLGRAQIVLADVIKQDDQEVKLSVKLLDKKLQQDKERGSLQVRLLWKYDPNAETIAKSFKKRMEQEHSLLHQLTSRLHLTVPDVQLDESDESLIAKINEEEGVVADESDDESDEDKLPLPPGAKKIRFVAVTIHRAEELPPLDALQFDKEKRKPTPPGGGIDAYVAAWLSSRPEDFVRTRIHTRKGRRDELKTSFHETLMLALPSDEKNTNVTLAVMDWDNIGGDEVVSHIELKDVEALVASKQQKPFWWNLYGAPLVGAQDKEAVDKVNEDTLAGSTYRGRILLTLKIVEKPSTAYDEKHQKRAARKLPKDQFPPSGVFRLRAHFLSAIGLPEPTGKYYLSLSCGTSEITSTQKAAINRSVEWNDTEESDRLLFPTDPTQIPDVVLSLCTGEWEKRVVVSYKRFTAAELLVHEFKDTAPVEWVPLIADPTTGAVKPNEFAGKVLLRLGFGPLASASAQVWDQKAMVDAVNRRVPYQVRVRLLGIKDVAKKDGKESDRKTPVHIRVQCADVEVEMTNMLLHEQTAKAFAVLDVNLPQLSLASQVLVHIKDLATKEKPESYVGTLSVSLDEAKDIAAVDSSAIVTRCTSEQLKNNTRPQAPVAKWMPLLSLDDRVETTHVLASVEIVRKMFPDEKLPPPDSTTP